MTRTVLKSKNAKTFERESPNQHILEKILPDEVFQEAKGIGSVCIFGPNESIEQLTVQSRPMNKDSRICIPAPRPTQKCAKNDILCKQ